jgi:hypothetical protein
MKRIIAVAGMMALVGCGGAEYEGDGGRYSDFVRCGYNGWIQSKTAVIVEVPRAGSLEPLDPGVDPDPEVELGMPAHVLLRLDTGSYRLDGDCAIDVVAGERDAGGNLTTQASVSAEYVAP